MKAIKIIISVVVLLACFPVFAQDILVISNSSVTETSLNKGTIKKIFLGKKTQWSSGDKIIPVTLAKDHESHSVFIKNFVGKSPGQFNAFWTQAIFTGKGTPPRFFSSEGALASYVASTKGAIGYVSSGSKISDVNIIDVSK